MDLMYKQKETEQRKCDRQRESGVLKKSEGSVCVRSQTPSLHAEPDHWYGTGQTHLGQSEMENTMVT